MGTDNRCTLERVIPVLISTKVQGINSVISNDLVSESGGIFKMVSTKGQLGAGQWGGAKINPPILTSTKL